MTTPSEFDMFLICVGDPRKGGDPLVVLLFGLVPAMCLIAVDRQSGSRWSARSAARTNDLEADEDPPHTRVGQDETKEVVVQVICGPPVRERGAGERCACRRPALSGSTDEGPAT